MIQLSPAAANKVKAFTDESPEYRGKDFRIFVESGNCGFSYGFTFDDRHADDEINEMGDVRVLIDPQSARYLNGAKVDYIEDMRGAGFVIDNPNTTGSCGCGNSVSF